MSFDQPVNLLFHFGVLFSIDWRGSVTQPFKALEDPCGISAGRHRMIVLGDCCRSGRGGGGPSF